MNCAAMMALCTYHVIPESFPASQLQLMTLKLSWSPSVQASLSLGLHINETNGDNSIRAGKWPSALQEVTELWDSDLGDVKLWESRRGERAKGSRTCQRRLIRSCKRSLMNDEMLARLMNCLRELCSVPGCHIFFLILPSWATEQSALIAVNERWITFQYVV